MSSIIDSIVERLRQGNVPAHKLVVKENQVFTLTVKELRACVAKNPNHPNAATFRDAVEGDPEELEVHVDRVDLEALISNRQVKLETEQDIQMVDGKRTLVTTERKTLGNEIGGQSAQPET